MAKRVCLHNAVLLMVSAVVGLCEIAYAGPMSLDGHFQVNESGAATYTVPIQIPPGRSGMEPKLALTYNSQGGNGLLGMGWSVSGMSAITRCPRSLAQDNLRGAVQFNSGDRFCLDGQRLMRVSGTYGADGTVYRTERDGFTKIISYGTAGSGPSYFRAWTKSGQVIDYGNTANSRIEAVKSPNSAAAWPVGTVRAWALNRVSDSTGNYLTYTYKEDGSAGDYYPIRIDYTGNAIQGIAPGTQVVFQYQTRTDSEIAFHAGSKSKLSVLLDSIQVLQNTGTTPLSRVDLSYKTQAGMGYPIMTSVQQCSGSGDCLPAIKFQTPTALVGFGEAEATDIRSWDNPLVRNIVADFNGDGRADMLVWHRPFDNHQYNLYLATDGGFAAPVPTGFKPWDNEDVNNTLVGDFNGDGKADLLAWHRPLLNGRYNLLLSNGKGFESAVATNIVTAGDTNRREMVADINGDGRSDVLVWSKPNNNARYNIYFSNGNGFDAVVETNVESWNNKQLNNQVVGDFNGDGKSDLLMWHVPFDNHRFNLYLSNGNGFAAAKATDIETWDNPLVRNIAADFNGDGKTDMLVWHRPFLNSRYNLYLSNGDGFEAATATDVRSWDNSDLNNQVVGDFNGDGKTDLLMWHVPFSNKRFNLYLSTGIGFLPAKATDIMTWDNPAITNEAADFDGDGKTDFLVWHAPLNNSRYNLYRSIANSPALITSVISGLGATTKPTYKPLTDADVYTKQATAVYPVVDVQAPLYVVSKVTSSNGIGGSQSTSYKYFYLKAEAGTGRGLLGFGRVDATQAETQILTRTYYNQVWPYIGMPSSTRKLLTGYGNAGMLNMASYAYECQHPVDGSACAVGYGKYYFPYVSKTTESSWDLDGTALPVVTTETDYDQFGNATQIKVSTGDGHSKTTTNTYANDEANWFLGRLQRSTVTSLTP